MAIFLINLALLFIWKLLFLDGGVFKNGRRLFCIFASLQWFVIVGLRRPDVGGDALAYQEHFLRSSLYNIESVLRHFQEFYLGDLPRDILDPGYDFLLLQPIHALGQSYQWLLIWVALILSISLYHFVYRHSKDCFISYLLFSTLFVSMLPLGGMRQCVAISLAVFWGYDLIVKRKAILFFLLIAFCVSIHSSVAVFAPFYFLSRFSITATRLATMLIFCCSLVPLSDYFYPLLASLLGYSEYVYDYVGASTWLYCIMFGLLGIFVFVRRRAILENSQNAQPYIMALICVLASLPFAFINSNALRAAWYYMVFLMLLVPCILDSFDKRTKTLLYLGITALSLICLVATAQLVLPSDGYHFFFESMI